MRGKVVFIFNAIKAVGITPAYAGKSEFPPAFTNVSRDHPRLCGEKLGTFSCTGVCWGSPPPMRGKVRPVHLFRHGIGITPAYAGKSSRNPLRLWRMRDHPRLCGEKGKIGIHCKDAVGSPPPMRGKEVRTATCSGHTGITPAYAGKRSKICICHIQHKDHPRLCGEKKLETVCNEVCIGSPPPMRGKDGTAHGRQQRHGITPAYAGKSRRPHRSR